MNEGELFTGGEADRPDVQGMRPGSEQGGAGQAVRSRPRTDTGRGRHDRGAEPRVLPQRSTSPGSPRCADG
ncbi:hypothetical protein IOD13_08315 [Brevibacterium casei]|nr:hypothetical protein [Brevibacterium casei]